MVSSDICLFVSYQTCQLFLEFGILDLLVLFAHLVDKQRQTNLSLALDYLVVCPCLLCLLLGWTGNYSTHEHDQTQVWSTVTLFVLPGQCTHLLIIDSQLACLVFSYSPELYHTVCEETWAFVGRFACTVTCELLPAILRSTCSVSALPVSRRSST